MSPQFKRDYCKNIHISSRFSGISKPNLAEKLLWCLIVKWKQKKFQRADGLIKIIIDTLTLCE